MTATAQPPLPPALARRFEAVVFDWDGTAVPDRRADASRVRGLVERLCAMGVHVAIVSGTHVGNVDGQLGARPQPPGRLLLALNRGSELFRVGRTGPRLVARRDPTPREDEALSRAAEATVEQLARRGLRSEIVSARLNRRKIDLIPEPEWADPPKAVIADLLAAVEQRLRDSGISGLTEVARMALACARAAGLADPKVTSDAKHVEIGLTDKADSARAVFTELWALGVASELVLLAGDEFGPLGGLPGSDAMMLVPAARGATACSVGVEPNGVPSGVVHVAGGPAAFLALLRAQVDRRTELPPVAQIPGWSLTFAGIDPEREHAHEALLTIADGVVGTSGAPLLENAAARPQVVAAGVYEGAGAQVDLLPAPRWDRLDGTLGENDLLVRTLDLRTGMLAERVRDGSSLDAVRFSSTARPGVVALRADVHPLRCAGALAPPPGANVLRGRRGGVEWMATRGARGAVAAAIAQGCGDHRVERLGAYVASTSPDGPAWEEALAHAERAATVGFDRLVTEQRCAWARRWEAADVEIGGDADLQLAVRVALYHLMSSVAETGEAAVGARGLTGHAYRGHVFWDSDVFVLPFLAATHPRAARAMLRYRERRLGAAIAAARAEGRSGARFPWESADTGEDVTPAAGRDLGGHLLPIRTGRAELHVVGDVAWATACYIDWTGDRYFARRAGHRILVETARYWASRLRVDEDGRAHIFGVIGPDEYHEPVDDNAFTNVLARWNLRRAAASVGAVGDRSVSPDERSHWLALADALVDGYDPRTHLYEQFSGFFGLEAIRVVDLTSRPVAADLVFGRDRVRASQIVKQADVLMLHHMIPEEVSAESLEPNLDFYEPRTAHGSSLSPGVHASVLARAGRLDGALAALRLAARIDLDFLTPTAAGGVHLAAMGSVWQALAFGFLGLRPQDDALGVDPRLPASWSGLEVRARFRGTHVRVRAERGELRVQASGPLVLLVGGAPIACSAGLTVIPLPS